MRALCAPRLIRGFLLVWLLAFTQTAMAEQDPTPVAEDPFEPHYIIESIEVRGNDTTRTDLILSYLDFKPGDLLDQERVELSRYRLLALGYFMDVHMRLERGTERGRVRLVVEVDERLTFPIIDDLFFGHSETNMFWGGLGVSDINFLGLGMVLSGTFVASENQFAVKAGGYWPSVLGTDYSAGIQGFYVQGRERALHEKIFDCQFDTDQNLNYWRAGGIASFGLRVGRVNRLSFELQGEHIQAEEFETVDDEGIACRNYPFLGYIRLDDKGSTLVSFAARFERDTRDDYFLPTRGMHLVISVELSSKAVLFSDYEYSKYMLQYEHSFRLWLDHVLRLTVVGGLIQDVGEQGSPFFKRFFIGDHALFLLYKDSLPRNLDLNFSTVTDYGDLLGSIEVEYDVPLWATGSFFYRGYAYASLNFSVLTKADFLASDEEWSGRTKRPVSFDLGLKFETPVGLLQFSVGYVMDVID